MDTLSNSGKLDVQHETVLVKYGGGTDPIASIKAQIIGGYAGGSWTGSTGITSSTAALNPGVYGVGYADSADPGNPAGLPAGTIEIKYTLLGDANLDGTVNTLDFNALAANFNGSGKVWAQGDFGYDGKVNALDFNAIAANFGMTTPAPALGSFAAANGLSLNVPEPMSVGLLVVAGVGALGRRRPT